MLENSSSLNINNKSASNSYRGVLSPTRKVGFPNMSKEILGKKFSFSKKHSMELKNSITSLQEHLIQRDSDDAIVENGLNSEKSPLRHLEHLRKFAEPLQMNSKIKFRNFIENILQNDTKESEIRKQIGQYKMKQEIKNMTKKVREINEISRFHDKYFQIDKRPKKNVIDTQGEWEKLGFLEQLKKRTHFFERKEQENKKFSFAEHQHQFEETWLERLNELPEEDKAFIFGLISRNKADENITQEELRKVIEPKKFMYQANLDKFKHQREQEEGDTEKQEKTFKNSSDFGSSPDLPKISPEKVRMSESRKSPLQAEIPKTMNNFFKGTGQSFASINKPVQDCDCKHNHELKAYTLKKKYQNLIKPSIIPNASRTLRELKKRARSLSNNASPQISAFSKSDKKKEGSPENLYSKANLFTGAKTPTSQFSKIANKPNKAGSLSVVLSDTIRQNYSITNHKTSNDNSQSEDTMKQILDQYGYNTSQKNKSPLHHSPKKLFSYLEQYKANMEKFEINLGEWHRTRPQNLPTVEGLKKILEQNHLIRLKKKSEKLRNMSNEQELDKRKNTWL